MNQNNFQITLLLFCLLCIPQLYGQTLEIKISNISKFGGRVHIAVFDSPSGWLKNPVQTATLATESDSEIVSFELPYGSYAISVYQDVNGNDKLDTNFMAIPKEPIAFGNNYKPFGKPKYKAAAFEFSPDYQRQSLKLYKIL